MFNRNFKIYNLSKQVPNNKFPLNKFENLHRKSLHLQFEHT